MLRKAVLLLTILTLAASAQERRSLRAVAAVEPRQVLVGEPVRVQLFLTNGWTESTALPHAYAIIVEKGGESFLLDRFAGFSWPLAAEGDLPAGGTFSVTLPYEPRLLQGVLTGHERLREAGDYTIRFAILPELEYVASDTNWAGPAPLVEDVLARAVAISEPVVLQVREPHGEDAVVWATMRDSLVRAKDRSGMARHAATAKRMFDEHPSSRYAIYLALEYPAVTDAECIEVLDRAASSAEAASAREFLSLASARQHQRLAVRVVSADLDSALRHRGQAMTLALRVAEQTTNADVRQQASDLLASIPSADELRRWHEEKGMRQ
jgi:hypothetical protein